MNETEQARVAGALMAERQMIEAATRRLPSGVILPHGSVFQLGFVTEFLGLPVRYGMRDEYALIYPFGEGLGL